MLQPNDRVMIGEDHATNEKVRIRDLERREGLYILGIQGTGKTTFLLSMIDQDIEHGHGLFFLDPHGDAIRAITESGRHADRLSRDLILLNPAYERSSFGINPLVCADPSSHEARSDAYNRTYRMFERIFGNEWGDHGSWGIWLQVILQHTIATFVENQGYTIADMPLFLSNPAFRDHLIRNMRYDEHTINFWLSEFGAETPHFQSEITQSLRTRLSVLLQHTRHILGQTTSTIDFADCIRRKAILLVALPTRLSPDIKGMLGKIILSELLVAVEARQDLRPTQRHQFCIYVDEVQHFANSYDFNILFPEARKYGIATTVAHQERFGQFADNKKIAGSTMAAANMLCFRLSPYDAAELAPAFAEAPPVETRRERELVVSEEPLTEMLRGHANPRINAFIRNRLRPVHEEISDLREDMEGLRLIRLDFLDQAAMDRLSAQVAGMGREFQAIEAQHRALTSAGETLDQAHMQTAQMLQHYERTRSLRGSLRVFNRFFTAVMEGRIAPGNDAFSTFLYERVDTGSQLPEYCRPILSLYLSLRYGDPTIPRALPLKLAQTYSLCAETVNALISASDHHTSQAREAFREACLVYETSRLRQKLSPPVPVDMTAFKRSLIPDAQFGPRQSPQTPRRENLPYGSIWELPLAYVLFVFLVATLGLYELLSPYRHARFATVSRAFACDINKFVAYLWRCYKEPPLGSDRYWSWSATSQYMKARVIRRLTTFLTTYGEGALVMLALVSMSRRRWPRPYSFYVDNCNLKHPLCMWDFIWIQDVDPIVLLKTVRKANELLRSHRADYKSYFIYDRFTIFDRLRGYSNRLTDEEVFKAGYDFSCPPFPDITFDNRKVVQSLHTDLTEKGHDSFAWIFWEAYDAETQWYLLNRVCDLVYLGQTIAACTFPAPIDEAQNVMVAVLVQFLTNVLDDQRAAYNAEVQKNHEDMIRKEEEKIKEECANNSVKIRKPPPEYLPARVIDDTERSLIIDACYKALSTGKAVGWNVDVTLAMIEEFVDFCVLLSKPENHVLVQSAQYVDKVVNTRTEHDMAGEMARKLGDLDRHFAYAKIIEHSGGRGRVRKRLIKTPTPLPVPIEGERALVPLWLASGVYRERERIDEEIRQRQARWRGTRQISGYSKKPPPIAH